MGVQFCSACLADRPPTDDASGLILHPALQSASWPCAAEALDAVFAAADYAPPFDRLILAMKRDQPALAQPLGRLAADSLATVFGIGLQPADHLSAIDAWLADLRPDLLVPMPLSAARLAERGFNPSWELARPVARLFDLPAPPGLLVRTRDTAPQKSLSAADRAVNLAGAFAAHPHAAGRRILLLDDVMTTGSTLREAARTLKSAGAASVVGLALARVR